MTTITVKIKSQSNARKFLYIVQNMKFVEKAFIEPEIDQHLTDEDWVKPGRPATDEEIEERLSRIDSEILENKLYSFDEVKKEISAILLK